MLVFHVFTLEFNDDKLLLVLIVKKGKKVYDGNIEHEKGTYRNMWSLNI